MELINDCILKVSIESIQKLFPIYCTLLCPNYSAFTFLMERSHNFTISKGTLLFLDILDTWAWIFVCSTLIKIDGINRTIRFLVTLSISR